MVSDFKKKKLLHVFNTFFDVDGSGSINKKDFDVALERIAKNKGYQPDDARLKKVEEGLTKIWSLLQSQADADNDGEISKDEWIAMWDEYTSNASTSSEWQNLYSKTIFDVVDSGSDGVIDEAEYSKHYAIHGISKEDAANSFQKASGGKTTITYPVYQELWKQYFLSEDQDAPGNYIFGKL